MPKKPESKWVDKRCASTIWLTPPDVIEAVHRLFPAGFLDPATEPENPSRASVFFTADDDGLSRDWSGHRSVFVNPPYGKVIRDWCAKIHEEADKGTEILALLPCGARFSTGYWQEHILSPGLDRILFFRGRVKFIKPDGSRSTSGPPYDSALYAWNLGSNRRFFDAIFEPFGRILKVRVLEPEQEIE